MEKEDQIIELLSELTKKINKGSFRLDIKQIVSIVIATLIITILTAFFTAMKTSQRTIITTKNDIREIKKEDNYNFKQISKTLHIPLVSHTVNNNYNNNN